MSENRPVWSSYLSFIIATIGSAVGLGNIWRFPYIMGKNGGAVFLITYLLIIGLICAIPLCVELAAGKIYKSDIISIYKSIDKRLTIFGYLTLITVVLVPCFYFVVGGWILNYIWIFATNNIPNDFGLYFNQMNLNPCLAPILSLVFLFIVAIFPYRGLNNGIEKANNIMMPLFAIVLIILAGYSVTLPNANLGLDFMFKPDFNAFSGKMVLAALGQALFTLSIGFGAMVAYGSYLKPNVNVKKSAYQLIFFDTLVAVLSGVMIFPIVFSNGIEPTAGASLAFISLPDIFVKMPYSNFFALLFFFLLFFAAVTSGISLMETAVSCFIDHFKYKRKKAVILTSLIIGIISIPASMSFGIMSDFKIFDKSFFDFLDFFTSNIMLPFNTLVLCVVAGWIAKNIYKEGFQNSRFGKILSFILKFILPPVLVLALVIGL